MKRFFVIGIDPTTKEQAESIEAWMKESNAAWWHWIDGMWLMATYDPNMTALSIRDKLKTLAPGVTTLVAAADPSEWAGWGPNSEERNMFKWLREQWKS